MFFNFYIFIEYEHAIRIIYAYHHFLGLILSTLVFHLITSTHPEKCVIKWFQHCATIQCTYTNSDSIGQSLDVLIMQSRNTVNRKYTLLCHKMDKLLIYLDGWMYLKNMILSKINQTHMFKFCIVSLHERKPK